MGLQGPPLPRKDRRARSKDGGEADPTDGGQADVVVLLATGSDLWNRPSAPTSVLPATYNQELNGMRTVLRLFPDVSPVTRPTFLRVVSGRTGFNFRRRNNHPEIVDHTVDPFVLPREGRSSWGFTTFSPLMSVAEGLSAILEHCDVLSPFCCATNDTYSCRSKR